MQWGAGMPSLIQNLIERAEAIHRAAEAARDEIKKQIDELESNLARLKAELSQIERVPIRHNVLLFAYESGNKLCPQCSLRRGVEIPMVGTGSGAADLDVFKCPSCGFEEHGEP
jgi:hypothetical protein